MKLMNGLDLVAEGDIEWIESESGYRVGDIIYVDVERKFTLIDDTKIKSDIEQALLNFAKEKDFDGIGEASALLKSSNIEWAKDASTLVRLWDETWQAFYDDKPLPSLKW